MTEHRKTVNVTEETHERLKQFGSVGDTFEDVINDALDALEEQRNQEG